jgi:hypothetical protein
MEGPTALDGGLAPRIIAELSGAIQSAQAALGALRALPAPPPASPIINLAEIEARAAHSATLRSLHTALRALTDELAEAAAASEAAHRAELQAAQEGLNRARRPAAEQISANAAATPQPADWAAAAARPQAAIAVRPGGRALRAVKVTETLSIDAVVVPPALKGSAEIYAAISGGELHYVPQWRHFAVRIGGCVLHANIGHIYRGPRVGPAVRVKECRRDWCVGRERCSYYHDPAEFVGSTDVRNHLADSWCYAAPPKGRRIGSADSFDSDLSRIKPEEARQFMQQVAHDLICALVIWRHAPHLRAA